MKILKVIILLGICVYIGQLLTKKDSWIAFYYPNPENLEIVRQSEILASLDACRSWILNQANAYNGYDYECGKNCKFDTGLNVMVCEETVE